MTGRRLLMVAVTVAPVGIAAVIALALALGGDRRQLVVATGVPLVVLLVGAAISVIAGLVAAVLAAARRARARTETSYARGFAEGRDLERSAHRRFLARLDHELKNPVTAIRATLAAAAPEGIPEGPLRVVDDQARRLATLVADLRKLAELETRPLDVEPVDLEQLLVDAVAALEQQHPEVRGRVALAVSRVPWPVPVVAGDPDLLGLAVDNVLANAAKFASTGPIEVRLREDAGTAVIEIADTGRGIPADDQPGVFDELARAGNARDIAGSGIGLSLVRAVLRRHGGDAKVRSREGEGTVVTMRLPAAPAEGGSGG